MKRKILLAVLEHWLHDNTFTIDSLIPGSKSKILELPHITPPHHHSGQVLRLEHN